MKKRHEQKMIVLSLVLFTIVNIPMVTVFNQQGSILGFPMFYFFIFTVWGIAIIISYLILYRRDE